jgi:hypothetical protein
MTTSAQCQCCGYPVGAIDHFEHARYPRGDVICRTCFYDRLLQDDAPDDVERACSRQGPQTSPDGLTDYTLTADGVAEKGMPGIVVWGAPTPPPDAIRGKVYWREDHVEDDVEDHDEGNDDDRATA